MIRWAERRTVWWLVALVGVIAAAILVSPLLTGKRTAASAYRYARAAQEQARAFETAPLGDPSSFESTVQRLVQAESQRRGDRPESAAWAGAVRLAMEFLRVCATGDPEVYAEWARSYGKELVGVFPIWGAENTAMYADQYRAVVGRVMPPDATPADYFRDYFTAYWRRGGGELRPASVAVDAEAVEVKTRVFTHPDDYIPGGTRSDGPGPLFWVGGITSAGMMLWWPARAIGPDGQARLNHAGPGAPTVYDVQRALYGSYIDRYGAVEAARVNLVYRSQTGVSVPVETICILRPDDRRWEMIGVRVSNVGQDVGVGSLPLRRPVY